METSELKKQFPDIDFDKIEAIISGASSIDGICASMKETFPDFNESEFKKAFETLSKETGLSADLIEETHDLSEKDLEEIAGGSSGSWFSRNKEWLIPVIAIGISAAAAPLLYKATKALVSKVGYSKGFEAGKTEALNEHLKLNGGLA